MQVMESGIPLIRSLLRLKNANCDHEHTTSKLRLHTLNYIMNDLSFLFLFSFAFRRHDHSSQSCMCQLNVVTD